MTDEQNATRASFIAMIRQNPNDKATRLVFADWCEEHGDNDMATMLRQGPKRWLRNFVKKHRGDYDRFINAVTNGQVFCFGQDIVHLKYDANDEIERDEKGDAIWDYRTETPQFWLAVELVTGVRKEQFEQGGGYFRCAC